MWCLNYNSIHIAYNYIRNFNKPPQTHAPLRLYTHISFRIKIYSLLMPRNQCFFPLRWRLSTLTSQQNPSRHPEGSLGARLWANILRQFPAKVHHNFGLNSIQQKLWRQRYIIRVLFKRYRPQWSQWRTFGLRPLLALRRENYSSWGAYWGRKKKDYGTFWR